MNVLIVESPSKAKSINKYLGSGFKVLASVGHVRDLSPKNDAIDTENDFQMNWETSDRGKKIIIIGFVSIVILFLIYGRYQDPEVFTPSALESIQRIALGFYITMITAIGGIGFGIYKYQKNKIEEQGKDILTIIAIVTSNLKSRKIFVAVFITYGIFFSLVSGTLVYQPEINFVTHYGATIPSGFIAPCCDGPGYMPKIIVYITEHVGLQVIPINFVLQVSLPRSWVGSGNCQ